MPDFNALIEAAAGRYADLARRFRPDAPAPQEFVASDGRRRVIAQPTLLDCRDAIVLSGEWFVLMGADIFADMYVQTPVPPVSAYLVATGADNAIALLYEEPRPIDAGFLLGGCPNYAHWLADYLPRLMFYRDPALPLLMNRPLTSFQRQSLSFLGIRDDGILELDYPGAVRVGRLFVPATCSALAMPPLGLRTAVLDWLVTTFAPLCDVARRDRRIFVSRAGEPHLHRRRLLNDAEIEDVARSEGFDIVAPERLSFTDQVTLFAEAGIIAGPHGAGLFNAIFAAAGARVIEMIGPRLAGEAIGSEMPSKVAAYRGQSFQRLVGATDLATPVAANHPAFETYTIDPAAFRRAVKG